MKSPLTRTVIVILSITTALLMVTQAFVLKLYVVPTASMEPLITEHSPGSIDDRILVNKLAFLQSEPQDGDVIAFRHGDLWWPHGETRLPQRSSLNQFLHELSEWTGLGPGLGGVVVKRVIATEGQTISCCTAQGKLLVDDFPIEEPYVEHDYEFVEGVRDCDTLIKSKRCFLQLTVPPNAYFVLGDNRNNSNDSLGNCRKIDTINLNCVSWVSRSDIIGKVEAIFNFPSRPFVVP